MRKKNHHFDKDGFRGIEKRERVVAKHGRLLIKGPPNGEEAK